MTGPKDWPTNPLYHLEDDPSYQYIFPCHPPPVRLTHLASTSQLTPPSSQDCVAQSLALQTLIAQRPQVVIDSSDSANNVVVFQLHNPATGVDGECAAHGGTLAPDGDPGVWYNCFVESRDPSITKEFRFDTASGRLTVNETWSCEGDGDGSVIWFLAFGVGNIDLPCKDQGTERLCMDDGDVAIEVVVSTR